jgi:uncharacterized protein with NRDE domain
MCLITFQWQPNADNKLVLSANRDEFLHRPALALQPWQDVDGVYAGKDLSQGGSWLGIHKSGRFAALTNHRDMRNKGPENPISRGNLVLDFLTSKTSAMDYLSALESQSHLYAGYNLLVADHDHLAYFSNRSNQPAQILEPGLYALSNALLNTPWPKVTSAKNSLSNWLKTPKSQQPSLAELLSSKTMADDNELPDTGIGIDMERVLSCQKIVTPNYGTRCSTGLVWSRNQIQIEEVSWLADGTESSRESHLIIL